VSNARVSQFPTQAVPAPMQAKLSEACKLLCTCTAVL